MPWGASLGSDLVFGFQTTLAAMNFFIHSPHVKLALEFKIDDGFFTGELIHDLPFPKPDNEGGYVNENPVKRPPGRKPTGTVVPEL